jgi:hypothetical protein
MLAWGGGETDFYDGVDFIPYAVFGGGLGSGGGLGFAPEPLPFPVHHFS